MDKPNQCPQCGSALPDSDALCLACALQIGMDLGGTQRLGPDFLDDLPVTGKEILIADKYRVIETIGRGGMGVVYKAWQENLDRVVAVKMVSSGAHAGPEEKARFLREAKTAGNLQHPGIVAVYDWGEEDGVPFFSMELVPGRDLASEVKEHGPLQPERAASLVRAVAEALAYAHAHGVLHRDLKPQNLLLTPQDTVKITDFGLAKAASLDASLTETGQVLGTAGYMAPEQALGKTVDPRVDVYGLGAVLYFLLTGRAPFVGRGVAEVLTQLEREDPVSLRKLNAALPIDLETICLKCLEREPDRRYADAGEVQAELRRFLAGEPIVARSATLLERVEKWRRRNPRLALAILGIALTALAWFATSAWLWSGSTQHKLDAQRTAVRLSFSNAEAALEKGPWEEGVARLAQELEQSPGNRYAEERLINLFNERRFLMATSPSSSGGTEAVPDPQSARHAARTPTGRLAVIITNQVFLCVTEGTGLSVPQAWKAHERVIRSVAFSPDGTFLVSASSDASACVWRSRDRVLVARLPHKAPVYHAVFSPDGDLVATACADGTIWVWRWRNRESIQMPSSSDRRVNGVAFASREAWLATASDDGTVGIWNTATGEAIAEAYHTPSPVEGVEWTADDRALRITLQQEDPSGAVTYLHRFLSLTGVDELTEGVDSAPAVRSSAPSSSPQPARRPGDEALRSSLMVKAGKLTITARDKEVGLRDAGDPAADVTWLVHEEKVNAMALSPDHLRLVTSTVGMKIRVWDVKLRLLLTDPMQCESPVLGLSFSSDAKWVIASTSAGDFTRRLHTSSGRAPSWLAPLATLVCGQSFTGAALSNIDDAQRLRLSEAVRDLTQADPGRDWVKRFAPDLLGTEVAR